MIYNFKLYIVIIQYISFKYLMYNLFLYVYIYFKWNI